MDILTEVVEMARKEKTLGGIGATERVLRTSDDQFIYQLPELWRYEMGTKQVNGR